MWSSARPGQLKPEPGAIGPPRCAPGRRANHRRQRLDEYRLDAERRDPDVVRAARRGANLGVVVVQLDQGLDVFGNEGDRRDHHAQARTPRRLDLRPRLRSEPADRPDPALVADPPVPFAAEPRAAIASAVASTCFW